MALGCSLAIGVLLVLTAGSTTEALKTRATFDKDFRSLFAIAPFGFGAGGHVELGITNFILWHKAGPGVPDPDVRRMGFFIAKSAAQTLLESELSKGKCALDAEHVVKLLTMDVVDQMEKKEFVFERALQDVTAEHVGGDVSIFFANCNAFNVSAVSMDLRTELYNLKPDGERDYLASEIALPTVV